jgi:hypothetical protein
MDIAIETVAKELWLIRFPHEAEDWVTIKSQSPVNWARNVEHARRIISRARLVPADDRLDLRLKREMVSR